LKIFRSELERGLDHRLFEIPAESLQLKDVSFAKNPIPCWISSFQQPDGFKLSVELDIHLQLTCDRCLTEFGQESSELFELRLTDIDMMVNEEETDILFFPESLLEIDLTPVLRDYIALAVPSKRLCRDNCKGLCPNCGINLNIDSCTCDSQRAPSPFDQLKKLTQDSE